MSFLTGKTKELSGTPTDIRGLREGLASFLGGSGFGNIFSGDLINGPESEFFLREILDPYKKMFSANREASLAQAKESAGNLTGSGYNNLFGSSLAQSLAGENAALSGIATQLTGMEQQRRAANANNFLSALLGLSTAGVAPPTTAYQPGFLDYAFQGASAAAPFLAGLPIFGAGKAPGGIPGSTYNPV